MTQAARSRVSSLVRAVPRGARELVLTVGAIGGSVCIVFALAALVFGLTPLIVQSGSMEPTITTGSLLITQKTPASGLKVGDVVTVKRRDQTLVTHRIVRITKRGDTATLRLKGDANDAVDPEVYVTRQAGREVVAIAYLGRVAAWASGRLGLFVLGLYVAFLLATVAIDRRDRSERGGNGGGKGTGGTGVGGRRKAARNAATVAGTSALVAGLAVPVLAPQPTFALFTDDAVAGTSTLTAYTVTKPVWVSCTITPNGVGVQKTATIVWQEVTSPYALDYTATVRETGTPLAVVDNGATRQTQFKASLLSSILNQAYHIDVVAKLSAPNAAWVSQTMTEQVTVTSLGLGMTCDSHN